jgi:hypothetical protein
MKSKSTLLAAWAGLLAVLLGVASSGCYSMKGSSSFASVEIRGHLNQQILQTTATVFRDDGYVLRSAVGDELIFERAGSSANQVAYGSWGSGVVLRVRAQVVPLGQGLTRLQCQASMVRNAGDRILEDEQWLGSFRSGPFQSLLDEAARRLK